MYIPGLSEILDIMQSVRRKSLQKERDELLGFIARLEKEVDPYNLNDDVTIDKMNTLRDLYDKLELVRSQLDNIG